MITEKDGKIIVDELLPMSDAPKRDRLNSENYPAIIAFKKGDKYGSLVDWSPIFKKWRISIEYYSDDSFHGWIPMPIYQPKEDVGPSFDNAEDLIKYLNEDDPEFHHGSDIQEKVKSAQEHFAKVAG